MATTMKTPLIAVLVATLLTSCTRYHVRKGNDAYSLMAYHKAQHHYAKALPHHPDRDVMIRMAESCRAQNLMLDAATWYHRADSIAPLNGTPAYNYGRCLLALGEMEKARDRFFAAVQENPENDEAVDLYMSCLSYPSFYADSGRFVVNALTLPGLTNVFSATPYKKGLLVAGEKEITLSKANPWNGMSFLDLYYCEKKTIVTWQEAQPLPGAVNGAFHEGPAIVADSGRTLYFTRSNYTDRKLGKDASHTSHLKLFRSTLDSSSKWSDVRAFAFNGEDFSVGHPALSSDGRTLYFASDRPGGFGGSDIWMSRDNGTGWSAPENLGPTINTQGNELFPTVNGNVLYFSSTAHSNMGGLDIFESHLENGAWSAPKNMNAPINTPHDDFGFVMEEAGKSGYLSSDRDGGDRIYTFTMYEPTFVLDGFVMDDSARYLPNMVVTLTNLANMQDTSMTTGADGHLSFHLEPNSDYKLKAERSDMMTSSRAITTRGLSRSDTLHVQFNMQPVIFNKAFALEDIYYDYDKWDLRPRSTVALDKVVRLCLENSDLTFELGAHTDCRGGDMYNLVLSDARANSAVNYLIQHGVSPDRIVAKGYGETMPRNKCSNGVKCTEEEHQANRRTEFKITGIREVVDQP